MESAGAGSYQQMDEKPLYDSANTGQVLQLLQPYYSDTVSAVIVKAYRITRTLTITQRQQYACNLTRLHKKFKANQ